MSKVFYIFRTGLYTKGVKSILHFILGRTIHMRKMDEMEKSIMLQSVRWSWAFGLISLAIYNIYLQISKQQTSITFIIMIGMLLIQQGIYQYKIRRVDDDKSFGGWATIIVIIVLFLLGWLFAIGVL